MNTSAAIASSGLKRGGRDWRGPKSEGRGSKFRTLHPSGRLARPAFPAGRASLESRFSRARRHFATSRHE